MKALCLKNRRVLISGAASGLGLALAKVFNSLGAKVCIADIDENNGHAALALLPNQDIDHYFTKLDVTVPADWAGVKEEIESRWGGLDVLVNNAGVAGTVGPMQSISSEDWQWVLNINLTGTITGCRTFIPTLAESSAGAIVNIASAAGLLNAPLMASYNVSKASVIALSETLHTELSTQGTRVVVACPAFFTTNLCSSLRSDIPGMQGRIQHLMSRSGVSAEDVAEQIVDALRGKKFMVITHALERRYWLIKRWWPSKFYQMLTNQAKKMIGGNNVKNSSGDENTKKDAQI